MSALYYVEFMRERGLQALVLERMVSRRRHGVELMRERDLQTLLERRENIMHDMIYSCRAKGMTI